MRVSGWDAALADYIDSKRDEPFAYGVNDCCCFVAGAVLAVTGEDRMSEFRGQYSTSLGSIKVLKEIGAGDLASTMDAKFPEVAKSHAGRGDIAFMDGCIGVIMGDYAWFVSDDGLEKAPRRLWDRCWGVARG